MKFTMMIIWSSMMMNTSCYVNIIISFIYIILLKMIQHKIHETSWFFFVMMIVLFIVSYLFWWFLFGVWPQRWDNWKIQRWLHNTVDSVSNQQQSWFPGMWWWWRRMQWQLSFQWWSNRNSTQWWSNRMSTTSIR